ncbi:MAG: branched-chain amino acid ABC transporter permease [Bacillota bacterium]|nr:branched-chain amino acid ABC transporter permease [Bacillota bacterium]
MHVLGQQLLNGLFQGSIYALIAVGYTMVYGIIKLINFAHGDILMIGAFLAYVAVNSLGFSFVPAMLFSMLGSAILGILIEKVAYKPLRNSPRITLLITAIGISLLLEYGMQLAQLAGPNPRAFPDMIKNNTHRFLGLQISNVQILIAVVTVMLVIALQFIVYRTKIGKAMRAASFDNEASKLMGINVDNVISFTFAIGSALGAAAGVLFAMYYPVIDPLMGIMPGLKAFIAAVLGGIGIIPGAMFGGIVLGLVEALTKSFDATAKFSDAIVFSILIIILLVRPAGLLGKLTREKV